MSPATILIPKFKARAFLLSLFVFIGLTGPIKAQNRSLDYYLSQAVNNNPAINEQNNQAVSARLQKEIITADLNRPTATATGDYMYAPYSSNWGYDPAITDGGHYSALLNVDYPLFTGTQRKARTDASSLAIRQSENQIKNIKHDLKQSVTNQYITAYQDLMQLRYLDDVHELLSQQKQITQSLADEGVARITDVKQLDIELQNNRISRKSADNTYQQDLLQLRTTVGISDTTTNVRLQEPAVTIENRRTDTDQSYFMNQFTLDSLDIAAQQQVAELKYEPTINLYGNTGLNAVKFTGIQNHLGYSVGFNVSIPIYDGGQRGITRQQSRLQQKSVDAYQQYLKTTRGQQLAGIRNRLKHNDEQLNLVRRQISQYQELLKDNRKELVQGIISVTEYLTILRNYADARQQLVQLQGGQMKLKNEYQYWNW